MRRERTRRKGMCGEVRKGLVEEPSLLKWRRLLVPVALSRHPPPSPRARSVLSRNSDAFDDDDATSTQDASG